MEREILHVNTDDFYASALRLRDPGLRGRPVIIAGPAPRGMVFSASYEARGDGVKRGMTVSAAERLCPRGNFLPPDWDLFRKVSGGIFDVLRRYSPVVEAVSLDEGCVDYTGCGRVFGSALDAGARIRKEVLAASGLEVSLGVASSRLVSHVASRTAKRAHMVDVYPGCERFFLAPVEIGRFPIAGEKHVPMLAGLGIRVVGDILLFSEEILSFCFGPWGKRLYRGALGEDPARVRSGKPEGTRFRVERTLQPDTDSRALLESFIYSMAEELGGRLRADREAARRFKVEAQYADSMAARAEGRAREGAAGSGAGRMRGGGTNDDAAIYSAAAEAFERLFTRRVRVRKLVLSAAATSPAPLQIGLFHEAGGDGREKARRVQAALDGLRNKYPAGIAPAFGRAVPALRAGGKA